MSKTRFHGPRVTLSEVADDAEVSTTTASVILSGREAGLSQFAPETVQRVRRSAERLGYSANLFASGLPSGGSPFFAMLIHNIGIEQEAGDWYMWGFEGDLLAGVIRTAAEAGAYPIVIRAGHDTNGTASQPVERIIAGGVSGVIARTPGVTIEKTLAARLRQGQPVVIVFPDCLDNWPTNAIDVDNQAAGRTAADLLARQGRKQWALIVPESALESQRLRQRGFTAAAAEHGASVSVIEVPAAECANKEAARGYLSARLRGQPFDGIFGAESVVSIGVLLAALGVGLRVGTDFNLVGCDCPVAESSIAAHHLRRYLVARGRHQGRPNAVEGGRYRQSSL